MPGRRFPIVDEVHITPVSYGVDQPLLFRAGYLIAERSATSILRDPFTNKPFVHFYATKRVGGQVVNSEAIKLMKFSV